MKRRSRLINHDDVVALLDLIPLAGATIAAFVVVLVAIAASGVTAAIVVAIFFLVYQQLENHLIQPLVYGRTEQLSPARPLNELDRATLYGGGEKGYTDYPTLKAAQAAE